MIRQTSESELCAVQRVTLHGVLEPLLAGFDELYLFDYPNHSNCGDAAIWLGERAVFHEIADKTVTVSDQATDSRMLEALKLAPNTIGVLLHGGGNTGRLWPVHSEYREKILSASAGRTVIQLPQTVDRSARPHLERLNMLAARTARFVFLVRDRPSEALFEGLTNIEVQLCPDSAFALHLKTPNRTRRRRWDVVWIRRNDHESSQYSVVRRDDISILVDDWLVSSETPVVRRFRASAAVRARTGFFRILSSNDALAHQRVLTFIFDLASERRVRRAVRLLDKGSVVITDRLHAHILCELLGIPHVLLDTKNRKVLDYHETFTSGSALVRVAGTPEDAVHAASELVSEVKRRTAPTTPKGSTAQRMIQR